MAVRHFEAEVRREPGGAVLDLKGEINGFAQEVLDAAYAEAEKTEGPVLLNFEEVDYINSTGIALIVGLLARARAAKRDLSAYGLSEHYVEIFNITRLSDFMGVFPDEESALGGTVAG
jgi:anti-sigma B factor antagonist